MLKPRLRPFSLVLTPLLTLYLLQNWGGERTGVTALLLYLPQHPWALYPLGFLLFGMMRKRRFLIEAGVLGLLFWTHSLLGYQFSGFKTLDRGRSDTLRLMSYNIERGAKGTDALERAIRQQKPDIVCLQESQGVNRNRPFAPGAPIAARFKSWNASTSGDVMTLSRFPRVSRRDYPLRGTRRILETTFQTPRGPVRVLNVHVATSFAGQSPRPRSKGGTLIRVVREAKPAAQARMQQTAPLQAAIENGDSKTPLIVAGDFNSPARGLFYGAISRNLADAWLLGGRGTGHTFPAHLPLLPIDHVLVRGMRVMRADVPDVRASDHRPMVVDFSF